MSQAGRHRGLQAARKEWGEGRSASTIFCADRLKCAYRIKRQAVVAGTRQTDREGLKQP